MGAAVETGNQKDSGDSTVGRPLKIAAAWSWRVIVVVGAAALFFWMLTPVMSIVIAILLALLVSSLVSPLVGWLKVKAHLRNAVAALVGLLVGMALIGALLALALNQLLRQLPEMMSGAVEGLDELLIWINVNFLDDSVEVSEYFSTLKQDLLLVLKNNSGLVASEAWTIASSTVSMVAAGLILLFTLFFFLKDGRSLWIWVVRQFPKNARNQVNEAGIRGWVTLGAYVRTQVQVAAIDALGIGLGAFFLGVPLAIPIAVLVFLASFVPIVGAFVSGAIAVFIALVNNGLTNAIIMFVVVLAVQQIESNVLQPWLMGQAVSLHPVAVVLAVTAGTILAGIPGAIFAVPILAVVNTITLYLHGYDQLPDLATDPDRDGGPPGTLDKMIAASYRHSHAAPIIDEQPEGSIKAGDDGAARSAQQA